MARSSRQEGRERLPAHHRGRLTNLSVCLSGWLPGRREIQSICWWLGSGETWLTTRHAPWLVQWPVATVAWPAFRWRLAVLPSWPVAEHVTRGSEGQQGAERRSGMRPSHSNPASLPGAVVCVRRSRTLRTLCRYASLQLSLTFPCIFDTAISTTHHRHLSTG